MRHLASWALAAALSSAPLPVAAEVAASGEGGFVSRNEVLVDATPQAAWEALLRPADWWNGDHTYSGDPNNLSIELKSGGCFCEGIPATGGEIEHMRVIYVAPR